MVKENLVDLTNNKKPFEIVQEVNNEIPSFEEFMKSYEGEKDVIDSYNSEVDSYGDLRVNKGYGPVHMGGWGSSSSSSSSSRGLEPGDPGWKPKPDFGPLNEFVPYAAKASLVATAGWLLGPKIAFQVGGLTWGTTKIIEGVIDNEDMKGVLNFIGDIGWDTAKGPFISKLIGVSADRLASKTTQEIGCRTAAKISANGGKIPADVRDLIRLGKLIYLGQKTYELYDEYGKPTCELARHAFHKDEGRSYDSNCEVCNP